MCPMLQQRISNSQSKFEGQLLSHCWMQSSQFFVIQKSLSCVISLHFEFSRLRPKMNVTIARNGLLNEFKQKHGTSRVYITKNWDFYIQRITRQPTFRPRLRIKNAPLKHWKNIKTGKIHFYQNRDHAPLIW